MTCVLVMIGMSQLPGETPPIIGRTFIVSFRAGRPAPFWAAVQQPVDAARLPKGSGTTRVMTTSCHTVAANFCCFVESAAACCCCGA